MRTILTVLLFLVLLSSRLPAQNAVDTIPWYFPLQQFPETVPAGKNDSGAILLFSLYTPAQHGRKADTFDSYGRISPYSYDTFNVRWFSRELWRLQEPLIYNVPLGPDDEMYRFTWLRSFHRPMAVRLSKRGKEYLLTWRVATVCVKGNKGQTSGAKRHMTRKERMIRSRYGNGALQQEGSRHVSRHTWLRFQQMVNNSGFDTMANVDGSVVNDGAEWVLEHKRPESYHVAAVHSMGLDAKYEQCCLYLLRRTHISLRWEKIY